MTLNDCKKSKILSDLKGIYQNNQRRQAIFFFLHHVSFLNSFYSLLHNFNIFPSPPEFFYSNLILEFSLPSSQSCSFPSSIFLFPPPPPVHNFIIFPPHFFYFPPPPHFIIYFFHARPHRPYIDPKKKNELPFKDLFKRNEEI